jgi:flagellar FliJ protein
MAGFKFRLQTLLDLKEQLEKSAKNELGVAVMKLEGEKAKLLEIESSISICLDDYRHACTGTIRPEKIKEIKYYLDFLQNEKRSQEANVKREQQNVDKIREKLVEILKERKILENLRDKNFEEYRKQETLKEQQQVDELVSYKKAAKMDRTE